MGRIDKWSHPMLVGGKVKSITFSDIYAMNGKSVAAAQVEIETDKGTLVLKPAQGTNNEPVIEYHVRSPLV